MIRGKVIGAIIGFLVANVLGLAIGLFLGHLYDTGAAQRFAPDGQNRERVEQIFFSTTFQLLGAIAKADGHISKIEITQTEQVMAHMGLTPDNRQRAIAYFKEGASPDFDRMAAVREFERICGRRFRLKQAMLGYMISLALADGSLDQAEEAVLRDIAAGFGIPEFSFNRLLEMIKAQRNFSGAGGGFGGQQESPAQAQSRLQEAYRALGVSESDSDKDIKRAYRKLLSENHPDKLIGQGMPEDMIKVATEKTQEIRRAYELIQAHRGQST